MQDDDLVKTLTSGTPRVTPLPGSARRGDHVHRRRQDLPDRLRRRARSRRGSGRHAAELHPDQGRRGGRRTGPRPATKKPRSPGPTPDPGRHHLPHRGGRRDRRRTGRLRHLRDRAVPAPPAPGGRTGSDRSGWRRQRPEGWPGGGAGRRSGRHVRSAIGLRRTATGRTGGRRRRSATVPTGRPTTTSRLAGGGVYGGRRLARGSTAGSRRRWGLRRAALARRWRRVGSARRAAGRRRCGRTARWPAVAGPRLPAAAPAGGVYGGRRGGPPAVYGGGRTVAPAGPAGRTSGRGAGSAAAAAAETARGPARRRGGAGRSAPGAVRRRATVTAWRCASTAAAPATLRRAPDDYDSLTRRPLAVRTAARPRTAQPESVAVARPDSARRSPGRQPRASAEEFRSGGVPPPPGP